MIRLLLALCALVFAVPAAAQGPLTLDQVLRSSAQNAPQIIEALAKQRQAEGKALSAEGAFDVVFDVDAQARPFGYYDGSVVEAKASRALDANGGGLYAGYRVSRGKFPVYEDKAYTNQLGEFKVGAVFSLLRDRVTDERRTRLRLADQDVDVARLEREMVAIGVQRRAMGAYQAWAIAGLRLKAYRDLLALSEKRRSQLARQVQLGARPQILITENDQNLARRRSLVAQAEQKLAETANALSFFWRDANGAPLVPETEQLPDALPELAIAPRKAGPILRPDLKTVLVRMDQSLARLDLAENDLKPRLDARAELGKDVGAIGLGGPSRTPAEAIVGVKFSVPLERRSARGRIAEAKAEIDGLRTRHRMLEEQIAIEVKGIAIGIEGADKVADLAAQEAELAGKMAVAEQRRFDMGASDFFLINQREESATDARLRALDARYQALVARADLAAATADRAVLGL
ncbi:Outer membrane efflux protein [Sphingomonas sp. NFR04]|uniref:TolC family protein n=1 Tax=Sphingomonas sp. NFR04 TaxID=1566283 RepID=UPI0008EA3809|nr:TolC family protein [Sphingomonas sp. NFR04]SFJ06638.1 Outer membrane efflux protein [Sphingomonas sp. NFR04]